MRIPDIVPSDIPASLLPRVGSFDFPSGAQIVRRIASEEDLAGWTVLIMPGSSQIMFSDGRIDRDPSYRAIAEMGLSGEDDLHDDDDWGRYRELTSKFTRMAILPLTHAYELILSSGYGNRYAIVGEKVRVRSTFGQRNPGPYDGLTATVIDDGISGGEDGRYVRVRFDEDVSRLDSNTDHQQLRQERAFPLYQLQFTAADI